MQIGKPLFFNIFIVICGFLAEIIARLHYLNVRSGLHNIPSCICNAPGGTYKNLQKIWLSRLFRRVISLLVRSPFRINTLQIVDFISPVTDIGCVIVTFHTPWARLLVQWCFEYNFALIITNTHLKQRASRIKVKGKGYTEMRNLVRHLQSGGRIIIAADIFNNLSNCPIKFLEKDRNASILPARLSKIANVPLMACVPELCNGTIHISSGPRLDLKMLNNDAHLATQNLFAFFELKLRRNPSIWAVFVSNSLSKHEW